ncbi:hypothetical protein [Streptomyces sp. TLI_053]|uniref:hypothetical protein n=1 Tax=Streptomyces sp. TLI_053 TaxID=1855352 RepID=UPI00135207CC|nr:hypothetical protein [Streptomyces sp. TLI_053]
MAKQGRLIDISSEPRKIQRRNALSGQRIDPVEIIARVGGVRPDVGGSERAFDVWVHLARKAGWDVIDDPGYSAADKGTACGIVSLEGLKYRIHYGLHVRQDMADDSTGHLTWRPVLAHAAWAEPILDGYELR